MWKLVFTKQAQADAKKIDAAGLRANAERLLETLEEDPFAPYPRYEKLLGDLRGAYSRRISIQRRLVYQVLQEEGIVKILRMWTHYEYEPDVPSSYRGECGIGPVGNVLRGRGMTSCQEFS